MKRIAAVAAVVLMAAACGRGLDSHSLGSSSDSLGAGQNDPKGDPGGGGAVEDPANGGTTTPSGKDDPGQPKDPGQSAVEPGDPAVCAPMEQKVVGCKEHNGSPADCEAAANELQKCVDANSPPANKPDPCGLFLDLFKSCLVTHPGDKFCDEVLASYAQCEAL